MASTQKKKKKKKKKKKEHFELGKGIHNSSFIQIAITYVKMEEPKKDKMTWIKKTKPKQ